MGCKYCGQTVIYSGKGRPRKFCSDRCAKNYAELLRQRRIKGLKVPLAWCKNCEERIEKTPISKGWYHPDTGYTGCPLTGA